jgi:pterin-4a-carbinolamine dehydratase
LHEEYIVQAGRPLEFGGMPVKAKEPEAPILPMDRWREVDGALYKTYRFRRTSDRNTFVMQLLAYESTTEHNAELRIERDVVDVKVQTHDLGKVTEIDKEYARYADILFRGLVYNPSNEDLSGL